MFAEPHQGFEVREVGHFLVAQAAAKLFIYRLGFVEYKQVAALVGSNEDAVERFDLYN